MGAARESAFGRGLGRLGQTVQEYLGHSAPAASVVPGRSFSTGPLQGGESKAFWRTAHLTPACRGRPTPDCAPSFPLLPGNKETESPTALVCCGSQGPGFRTMKSWVQQDSANLGVDCSENCRGARRSSKARPGPGALRALSESQSNP